MGVTGSAYVVVWRPDGTGLSGTRYLSGVEEHSRPEPLPAAAPALSVADRILQALEAGPQTRQQLATVLGVESPQTLNTPLHALLTRERIRAHRAILGARPKRQMVRVYALG